MFSLTDPLRTSTYKTAYGADNQTATLDFSDIAPERRQATAHYVAAVTLQMFSEAGVGVELSMAADTSVTVRKPATQSGAAFKKQMNAVRAELLRLCAWGRAVPRKSTTGR